MSNPFSWEEAFNKWVQATGLVDDELPADKKELFLLIEKNSFKAGWDAADLALSKLNLLLKEEDDGSKKEED